MHRKARPVSRCFDLEKKIYVKRFLDLRTKELQYDFSKLEVVLDRMVDACSSIATQNRTFPT